MVLAFDLRKVFLEIMKQPYFSRDVVNVYHGHCGGTFRVGVDVDSAARTLSGYSRLSAQGCSANINALIYHSLSRDSNKKWRWKVRGDK